MIQGLCMMPALPGIGREASSSQRPQLVILLAVVHEAEQNNSLCLSFIGSGVLSVVKMCFFNRQSKYNFQGTQEANVGKSKVPLLRGPIGDEERRGMQPARLWRHSSENTLCKQLTSVHSSKDAQKQFRINQFPVKSSNRKWPDLLHPTQGSGTSL